MTSVLQLCISCQKPLPLGAAYCPTCGHQQPPKSTAPLGLGERRLVTILFADLASFTAVSEKTDPEDLIDMLNHIFNRLMVECDREGGYLDKTVGDQMMVLFGAPRAHEDDPVRAVRAALAMQAAMEELAPIMREKTGTVCKLNIGINTGPVVWGQVGPTGRTAPTVIGDAVNLACRLQQAAKGGQTLVSEAVYLRARRIFEFKTFDPITVKNKSGAIPVYMPLNPHQNLIAGQTLVEMRIPLIERKQELETLSTHWSQAIANQPQLVLIKGGAGLGKSRLLAEFVENIGNYAIDKQPLALSTHCGSTANYEPLTELLYQLFGLTPDDTDLIRRRKLEDRARILGMSDPKFVLIMGYLLGWYQNDPRLVEDETKISSLRELALKIAANLILKQSTHRPLIIIIDDLQWANADTGKWLTLLTKTIEGPENEAWHSLCRLMVVVAARSETGTLITLPQPNGLISLTPLPDTARRDLIEHLLPGRDLPLFLSERLSQESEGNPLYLIETIRGLIQSKQLVRHNGSWRLARSDNQLEIPQSIEGLVMADLDALKSDTRNVLQHAAVIGQNFSYGLLEAITPIDDLHERLLELEQRGLIARVSGNGHKADWSFTFTHTVTRVVAYQSILRKTRRDLHNRIAELTEVKTSRSPEDLKKLAHHYAAAGDDQEKLVAYNWLTGRRALNEFNFEEAYRHLQLAWTTIKEIPHTSPEIYQDLVDTLGDASTFTGNFAQANTCYQELQGLLGDTPGEQAQLYYKLGRLNFYQGETEAATQYFEQALKLASANLKIKSQIEAEMRLLYDIG